MNTDEVEDFRGCAGMLPLMRETRIAGQLQEYLPAPDSTLRIKNDDIEKAFCKKYGKNNFSEIIENQLGDFSLLTKKQQESFLKYVQSIFVSFPDIAAGEQSEGIKLSCSHFPFNDNLFERTIDELKYKKLMTLSKIFKSIIGEFPSPPYGTVMPVSFRPYITGFNGDHCLTPEENRLATNLTSALRSIIDDYVLFKVSRNIIEGIGKKADVPTDLPVVYAAAKSLFVDGALKALEEMISHIGSGPNAELVKIMRREVEIKKKKNKIMSEEQCAGKIIDSVAAFTRRFGDILDEKKKVLYNPIEETANEGHRVGLKIDDDVFATLIFNVRNVYYDGDTNSSSNLDSVELEFIEENNKYILGTLWRNGFRDIKAVVEKRLLKIIHSRESESRSGKFTKLFRERPADLARSVENSCTAYADSYEDFLKKRILADKDDFYKVFQEEFPEELAEEFFCATPVSPGRGM